MNEFEADVTEKLGTLIRLVALDVTKGRPLREKILLLSHAGFAPKEIAVILGKTPNSVRVMLSRMRRGGSETNLEGDEAAG
jgi:DNA-directed RNA polymerase specialized sigma24 family protein